MGKGSGFRGRKGGNRRGSEAIEGGREAFEVMREAIGGRR